MKGIGVDIVDLRRLDIDNQHFIERVLSPQEQCVFNKLVSSKRKREYLGGRFAGKEAYLKAKHQGIGSIDMREITILNDDFGCPFLNDEQAQISISHENNYAIAFVVIEK